MTTEIYQVAYISAATVPFAEPDLRALLAKARFKNGRLSISGILVHEGGSFLQIIEGPEANVSLLYKTIEADRRHDRILRIFASSARERSFADWSMGYVASNDELANVPGYNDFLRAGFARTRYTPQLATKLRDLALQFRVGRWRQRVDGGDRRHPE